MAPATPMAEPPPPPSELTASLELACGGVSALLGDVATSGGDAEWNEAKLGGVVIFLDWLRENPWAFEVMVMMMMMMMMMVVVVMIMIMMMMTWVVVLVVMAVIMMMGGGMITTVTVR
jgi:hypothetical protein